MIRKDAVSISMEAASFCGFDIVPIGFCFIYLHKIVRMKHVLVVLLLVGAAITGCKKNKNANAGPDPGPVIPKGMNATINGVSFVASTTSYVSLANYLQFTGYDTAGRTIILHINNFKTTGKFSVPQANDSIFYSADYGSLSMPVSTGFGTVEIYTVNDTLVAGTFSFTATGGLSVTGGTFSTNY